MVVRIADTDNTFIIILINMERLATSINACFKWEQLRAKAENLGRSEGIKYECDATMWFR